VKPERPLPRRPGRSRPNIDPDDPAAVRERRLMRLNAYVAPLPLLALFVLGARDQVPCGSEPCPDVMDRAGPGMLLHAMTGSLLGGILGTVTLVLLVQALRHQHRLARRTGKLSWF
jgi:hypothetical protein